MLFCSITISLLPKFIQNKFTSAEGGPRYRVCVRATLRFDPHQHQHKLIGAHACNATRNMLILSEITYLHASMQL